MHKVVIIGVGSIGERHLRCFKATGRAEVGFVETNPTLRAAIAERYAIPPTNVFDSLDAAIAGGSFTASLVATPAQLHVPMATRLVEAGLHTLIEKPLSTSFDGLPKLRALVRERGVTAGVAYTYRSMRPLGAMRRAILDGRFGKPLQVVVVAGQNFPTYRPAYRDIYYKDRRTGGGAIQDAITHLLNAAEWIVGPIDRLIADAAHLALPGVSVEDTVHIVARHGAVLGSYSLNQYQAPNETLLTVICERGVARFEAHLHRWRWTTTPGEDWHNEEFGPVERDTHYITQANIFLDAIEGKGGVTCTLEEGEQTLRVNLAALASADRGDLRPLPPA